MMPGFMPVSTPAAEGSSTLRGIPSVPPQPQGYMQQQPTNPFGLPSHAAAAVQAWPPQQQQQQAAFGGLPGMHLPAGLGPGIGMMSGCQGGVNPSALTHALQAVQSAQLGSDNAMQQDPLAAAADIHMVPSSLPMSPTSSMQADLMAGAAMQAAMQQHRQEQGAYYSLHRSPRAPRVSGSFGSLPRLFAASTAAMAQGGSPTCGLFGAGSLPSGSAGGSGRGLLDLMSFEAAQLGGSCGWLHGSMGALLAADNPTPADLSPLTGSMSDLAGADAHAAMLEDTATGGASRRAGNPAGAAAQGSMTDVAGQHAADRGVVMGAIAAAGLRGANGSDTMPGGVLGLQGGYVGPLLPLPQYTDAPMVWYDAEDEH